MYSAANEFSNRRKERIRFTGNESNPFPCRFPKTGVYFFMVICDKTIYVDNFVWNVVSLCAQKNE